MTSIKKNTGPFLFLDIDGVLNHDNTPPSRLTDKDVPLRHMGKIWLDRTRIQRLNKILDEAPNTMIILSSTWREYGIKEVEKALRTNGFRYRIHDRTPFMSFGGWGCGIDRGNEILLWFEANLLEPWDCTFAILDDIPLENKADLWGNQVLTTDCPVTGFTDDHVALAVDLLKT